MGRALLVIAILCAAFQYAGAQSDASPEVPSGAAPKSAPECQQLLALRSELLKEAEAIEAANQKKANAATACRLFRNYLATEAKMIKMLDANGAECGVPQRINQGVKASHPKTQRIGNQVCDAAKRQPFRYDPPQLYDERELQMFKLNTLPSRLSRKNRSAA
jgi:hypothetical protein